MGDAAMKNRAACTIQRQSTCRLIHAVFATSEFRRATNLQLSTRPGGGSELAWKTKTMQPANQLYDHLFTDLNRIWAWRGSHRAPHRRLNSSTKKRKC